MTSSQVALAVLAVASFTIGFGHTSAAADMADQSDTLILADTTDMQFIFTSDGSKLVGRIVAADEDYVTVVTDIGEITISLDKITQIKPVPKSSMRGGEYWFDNPNLTRLYLSPTARMPRAGSGYFMDAYLFFTAIGVGVTDWLTLGGGTTIIPGIGMDDQLIYFMPKIGLAAGDNAAFAVSGIIIQLPDNEGTAGFVTGLATLGPPDQSVTLGLGWGFDEEEFEKRPAIIAGADLRMSRRTSFVTENWMIPGVDNPVISYGFRFFGESISADLGFFAPTGEDFFFPGIPYVDFVYNF